MTRLIRVPLSYFTLSERETAFYDKNCHFSIIILILCWYITGIIQWKRQQRHGWYILNFHLRRQFPFSFFFLYSCAIFLSFSLVRLTFINVFSEYSFCCHCCWSIIQQQIFTSNNDNTNMLSFKIFSYLLPCAERNKEILLTKWKIFYCSFFFERRCSWFYNGDERILFFSYIQKCFASHIVTSEDREGREIIRSF